MKKTSNKEMWQILWNKANARCKILFNIWENADGFALCEWENYSRAYKLRQYIFDRKLQTYNA